MKFVNNKSWCDNLEVLYGTRNFLLALIPVRRELKHPSYYYEKE